MAKLGGLTYFDVYFPVVIVLSVSILALVNLPTAWRASRTGDPPTACHNASAAVVDARRPALMNVALAVVALGVVTIVATTGTASACPRVSVGSFSPCC